MRDEDILKRIFGQPVYEPAAQWDWIFGFVERQFTAAIFKHAPNDFEMTEAAWGARLNGLMRLANELGFEAEVQAYLATVRPTELAHLRKHGLADY